MIDQTLTPPVLKAKADPTESEEQQALIKWADETPLSADADSPRIGDFLFSLPNGAATQGRFNMNGQRFSSAAMRLKREGLRPGVPDLMLAIPSQNFHGLFIEMKRAKRSKSVVRDGQKEWLERLNSQGYKAVICYGCEQAQQAITDYLNPPKDAA